MHFSHDTRESVLQGVFYGFSPQSVYLLADGSCWLQTGPQQIPHHAVCPAVIVRTLDDGDFLSVAGLEHSVSVQPLEQIIVSQIRGRFSGWTGKTAYTLTNGQTWQQAKFLQKFTVKYMPDVLVYLTEQGWIMQVAGTRVKVRQIR